MNYKPIFLLIVGILIVIFPQYLRRYSLSRLGEKPTKSFIYIQRVTGAVLIIIAFVIIVFHISDT